MKAENKIVWLTLAGVAGSLFAPEMLGQSSLKPTLERVEARLHAINPLSPPSDPVQRRLQSPPAKSKFLAV